MNIQRKLKELKLRARDYKNKITGKDKVIKEYNEVVHEMTSASDKEKDPEIKKELMALCDNVLESKWHTAKDGMSVSYDSYNPYEGSKKKTLSKIEMAKIGLEKINASR